MAIIGTIPGIPSSLESDAITAGTIITSVRDQIPDPVYDPSGNPLPDDDGNLFRAQTLYRWLNDGIRAAAMKTGWSTLDWWPLRLIAGQTQYAVDPKWITIDEACGNQYPLAHQPDRNRYPLAVQGPQPLNYTVVRALNHLTVLLWPSPLSDDPTTTLSDSCGEMDNVISLTDTSGFLPFGYVYIEQEILRYNRLITGGSQIAALTRGAASTTAASHVSGVPVFHCGAWVRGARTTAMVASSGSLIEIPPAYRHALELYVLARARHAEQEFQAFQMLMQMFDAEMNTIITRAVQRDGSPGVVQAPTMQEVRQHVAQQTDRGVQGGAHP